MNWPGTEQARAWALVFVALLLAPLVFGTRGHALEAGDQIEVALTLITADRGDLACALPRAVGRYRCGFEAPGRAFAPDLLLPGQLQPFVTEQGVMFLVAELFAERAVGRRYAAESPDGRPRAAYRRFVARCRVRLLGRADGALVRFGRDGRWDRVPGLWAVDPIACRVSG